ncbi:MAG: hypothetical protein ACRDZY_12270, partial [Acidimicrobiales bacterium]
MLHDPKRRKMLIYAGVAGALLLVALLARRSSANSAAAAGQQPTAVPVSNPAVDPASYYTGGSGAGGVDYGPQLASLDTNIQTLAQAVQAGQFNAQNPGPSTPGSSGTTDPTAGGNDLASIFGAFSAAEAGGVAA